MNTQGVVVPLSGAGLARGEGIDRVRLLSAVGVVFCHSAMMTSNPAFAAAPLEMRMADALFIHLAKTFIVNGFLLVSFLLLEPKIRSGGPWHRLVGKRVLRLLPAYLFWTAVYGAFRIGGGLRPSAGNVAQMLLLGGAAAHLYYVPLLVGLTAAYPIFDRLARRPWLGLAIGPVLALGASYADAALAPRSPYLQALFGILGVSFAAVTGLSLSRLWTGLAPPPERRATVLWLAVLVATLAGAVIADHALAEAAAGAEVPFGFTGRLAVVGYSLAIPVLLLALPVRTPWASALAPLSFGIYLVHPVFVKALQFVESRVPAISGPPWVLALPNAIVALLASSAAVAVLLRTPIRRLVS